MERINFINEEKKYKVISLFAGIGGFDLGFSNAGFNVIWANDFDKYACETYKANVSTNIVCDDIRNQLDNIPDHDILVGGFPCQDYSVARTLSQAAGIEGKKGVLWWQIVRIVRDKGENAPQILFLENVDRLLGSPARQRGRDFAIILNSLNELGYSVEWRIINAADYGMPQRRRRTYILAYRKNSVIANQISDATEWVFNDGIFAKAFPIYDNNELLPLVPIPLKENSNWDMADLSAEFNKDGKNSPFQNAGLMVDGYFYTYKTIPKYSGDYMTLGDILVKGDDRELITEDFYIQEQDLPKWEYLKGAKHELRKTKEGFEFSYNEGGVAFPDSLDKPSRTIITSEGGVTPSRFKHVIKDPVNGRLRRLIPLELERLDMFPDNHTIGENDTKRAFFMGNALVCGIVTKVGEEIRRRLI